MKKKKSATTRKRLPRRHQLKASAYHLKPAEVKKLIIAATNFRDRCIVKTLYWLGLRRHELIAFDIRDIDVDRKRVEVRSGKGKKSRTIPIIEDEFLSDIIHLIGHRQTGPVFLSYEQKPLSPRLVNYVVANVGERAGVTNPNARLRHLNPHLLRHSISRFLKSKGFTAEWAHSTLLWPIVHWAHSTLLFRLAA